MPGQTRDGRLFVRMVTPKQTASKEAEIRQIFKQRFPNLTTHDGPVMFRFTAVFGIPQSWPARDKALAESGQLYHTCKPDKDNIEKLIVDALHGLAWIDDAQVQGGGVKRYGSPERIDITIEFLPDPRKAHRAAQGALDL